MTIVDEQDLRLQISSVLDAITPSEAPVRATIRKGKIIEAWRSLGIVAGLAVVAGIGVGTPGLLHQPVRQTARPTVMVQPICPTPRYGVSEPAHPPELAALATGELPAAGLAAGGCAWLVP
jgi:hypothetical protein